MKANDYQPQKDLSSQASLLIEMERSVLEAFKNKSDQDFTKNFAEDYIGVANDGVKDAAGEITGMHKFDLKELFFKNERVTFPAANVAILTYTMVTSGQMQGKDFSASIFTTSVYVKQQDEWVTVLHTESKGN